MELEKNIEKISAKKSPGRRKNGTNHLRPTTLTKSPRARHRSQTPPSRLPKGHDDSMTPMGMTDEEFQHRFARRKSIEDGML